MSIENSEISTPTQCGNLKKYPLIDRDEGFTQLDNRVINRQIGELTPDALALLIKLLSLPNDWNLFMIWLQKTIGYSTARVRRAKKELIKKGFLEVDEIRLNGKKAYKYKVYELPKSMMEEQNQVLEAKHLNPNSDKQSKEKDAQINKNNKQENIKKNNKKDKINICKTKDFAEGKSNLLKAKDSFTEEQVLHVNHVKNTNMNTCSSNNKLINSADTENNKQIQQKRANTREKYEQRVNQLIDNSSDIPTELKALLKNHVTARFEKGIRTTPTMFKQLYADLIDECPNIEEQIRRVKIATSNGYPDFRLRKKDKFKNTNQPILVSSNNSDDNNEENYTYI